MLLELVYCYALVWGADRLWNRRSTA